MSSRPPLSADLELGARVAHLELDRVWAVDPVAGREGPADLVVEDGRLTSFEWASDGRGSRDGLVVTPGFTDLHAHFREPGFEDAETVATGQDAAAHGGFTTVCVMANTDPPLDEAAVLREVPARASQSGSPVRVLAWGAATQRREGKALADLGDLAKAAGLPVTCDVTPHHVALSDEWLAGARRWSWQAGDTNAWAAGALGSQAYDPALKVNPPLRSPTDARALLAGVRDGTVDAIATDHAPHTLVDKEVEFGAAANGISGIETALGLLLEAVAAGELTLLEAVRALRVGPARVLEGERAAGQHRPRPALAIGEPADLVLFDPDDAWLVSESSLRSKGKNSPLLGRSMPGRVLATIAGGRLAYLDPDLAE